MNRLIAMAIALGLCAAVGVACREDSEPVDNEAACSDFVQTIHGLECYDPPNTPAVELDCAEYVVFDCDLSAFWDCLEACHVCKDGVMDEDSLEERSDCAGLGRCP